MKGMRSTALGLVCRCMVRLPWLVLTLGVGAAHATLGEPLESVHADQIRLQGRRVQNTAWPTQMHEIQLADGSRVRQYVNAVGAVFAVTWTSRLKPDLAGLLGQRYTAYVQARPQPASLHAARQPSTVQAPDLVVRQSGRGQAHTGMAYVPTLTPRGFDVAQLR